MPARRNIGSRNRQCYSKPFIPEMPTRQVLDDESQKVRGPRFIKCNIVISDLIRKGKMVLFILFEKPGEPPDPGRVNTENRTGQGMFKAGVIGSGRSGFTATFGLHGSVVCLPTRRALNSVSNPLVVGIEGIFAGFLMTFVGFPVELHLTAQLPQPSHERFSSLERCIPIPLAMKDEDGNVAKQGEQLGIGEIRVVISRIPGVGYVGMAAEDGEASELPGCFIECSIDAVTAHRKSAEDDFGRVDRVVNDYSGDSFGDILLGMVERIAVGGAASPGGQSDKAFGNHFLRPGQIILGRGAAVQIDKEGIGKFRVKVLRDPDHI